MVIPIAAVDPVQAIELTARAAVWLAAVLQRHRKKTERAAAIMLRELGCLTITAHALTNAARAATSPLFLYQDDWDDDQKRDVIEKLDAFLGDSFLVPELARAFAALANLDEMRINGALRLDSEVERAVDTQRIAWYGEWVVGRAESTDSSLHQANLVGVWKEMVNSREMAASASVEVGTSARSVCDCG